MTTVQRPVVDVPNDAFTSHLSRCTDGCDVKLDGTGPLCAAGEKAMESVDWTALSKLRDRATREIDLRWDQDTREKATGLLARLQMGRVVEAGES